MNRMSLHVFHHSNLKYNERERERERERESNLIEQTERRPHENMHYAIAFLS